MISYFSRRKDQRVLDKWTRAVQLEDNSFDSVCRAVGALRKYRPVFQDSSDGMFLGDNLVAHLPIGSTAKPDTPVIQLALILCSSYFLADNTPKTDTFPNFSIGGVPLNLNAADFLEKSREAGHKIFSVATEPDCYTVDIGAIQIECLKPHQMDPPEKAFPSAIRFYYLFERHHRLQSPMLEIA